MTLKLRNAYGDVYDAKTRTVGGEVVPQVDADVPLPIAFVHAQATVGTNAVQLTATPTPCSTTPIVKADGANTGTVYVINSSAGTVSTGVPLGAGEALPVPIDDLSKIWLIASGTGQKAAGIAGAVD